MPRTSTSSGASRDRYAETLTAPAAAHRAPCRVFRSCLLPGRRLSKDRAQRLDDVLLVLLCHLWTERETERSVGDRQRNRERRWLDAVTASVVRMQMHTAIVNTSPDLALAELVENFVTCNRCFVRDLDRVEVPRVSS